MNKKLIIIALSTIAATAALTVSAETADSHRTEKDTAIELAKTGDRLDILIAEFQNHTLSEEHKTEFFEAVRTSKEFENRLNELEQAVANSPQVVELKMDLGNLYLYKLMAEKSFTNKGSWSTKAEKQWTDVLELNPKHWEARHNIAIALSHYPEFLNRQNDSISHYERLIDIQGEMETEERFQQAYIGLSKMYLKSGDNENSKKIATKALTLFPNNKNLQKLSQKSAKE